MAPGIRGGCKPNEIGIFVRTEGLPCPFAIIFAFVSQSPDAALTRYVKYLYNYSRRGI